MIEITIKLNPFGIGNKRILHEITIANNCKSKNRPEFGNYNLKIDDKEYKDIVKEFKRSEGAIKLLHKCLDNLLCKN
jgi:hypothetical protein